MAAGRLSETQALCLLQQPRAGLDACALLGLQGPFPAQLLLGSEAAPSPAGSPTAPSPVWGGGTGSCVQGSTPYSVGGGGIK